MDYATADPAARRRGRIALLAVFAALVAVAATVVLFTTVGSSAEPEVSYTYAVSEDVVWIKVDDNPGESALRGIFTSVRSKVSGPGTYSVVISCSSDDYVFLARGRFGPGVQEFTPAKARSCP
ncbi:hypothetical protein [Actinokineospora globicatena]|uniref:Uncharacterized protein n=1 Tax=Actinokineospora globicatena TaxID=103729 RepID=A0A9W6QUZ1_9PSEU|nr:hypothetical protein [Actinokineospora globicatena]GLW95064.1 hypothetical protein Aglo03_58800 [Actinokineospora globicatena]